MRRREPLTFRIEGVDGFNFIIRPWSENIDETGLFRSSSLRWADTRKQKQTLRTRRHINDVVISWTTASRSRPMRRIVLFVPPCKWETRTFIALSSSWASYTGASISSPRTTLRKFPLSSEDRSSARSCRRTGKDGHSQTLNASIRLLVIRGLNSVSMFGFAPSAWRWDMTSHAPLSPHVSRRGCGFWTLCLRPEKRFHKTQAVWPHVDIVRRDSLFLPARIPLTSSTVSHTEDLSDNFIDIFQGTEEWAAYLMSIQLTPGLQLDNNEPGNSQCGGRLVVQCLFIHSPLCDRLQGRPCAAVFQVTINVCFTVDG